MTFNIVLIPACILICPFAGVTALTERKNIKRYRAETSTITASAFSYRAVL